MHILAHGVGADAVAAMLPVVGMATLLSLSGGICLLVKKNGTICIVLGMGGIVLSLLGICLYFLFNIDSIHEIPEALLDMPSNPLFMIPLVLGVLTVGSGVVTKLFRKRRN